MVGRLAKEIGMMLLMFAALAAPADLLPEIDRAALDRQARIEARRDFAAPARSAPRAGPPRARRVPASLDASNLRLPSQPAIIGM